MIKNVFNESAKSELKKMQTINHENIVKYYDHFIHSGHIEHICIITEYCQVTIFSLKKFKINS